jgi:hypothetical protein
MIGLFVKLTYLLAVVIFLEEAACRSEFLSPATIKDALD